MIELVAAPLSAAAFAPFGAVLSADRDDVRARPANQGTAVRQDFLAPLLDLRPGRARPNLAAFRCAPRGPFPLQLSLLERHPDSTQVFVPMSARSYAVVVALGGEAPDLGTARAFLAGRRQGVAYAPGVWHHPMIALGSAADFVCLVYEDGGERDCVERHFAAGEGIRLVLPAGARRGLKRSGPAPKT